MFPLATPATQIGWKLARAHRKAVLVRALIGKGGCASNAEACQQRAQQHHGKADAVASALAKATPLYVSPDSGELARSFPGEGKGVSIAGGMANGSAAKPPPAHVHAHAPAPAPTPAPAPAPAHAPAPAPASAPAPAPAPAAKAPAPAAEDDDDDDDDDADDEDLDLFGEMTPVRSAPCRQVNWLGACHSEQRMAAHSAPSTCGQ